LSFHSGFKFNFALSFNWWHKGITKEKVGINRFGYKEYKSENTDPNKNVSEILFIHY
jgi:hypothetical protein